LYRIVNKGFGFHVYCSLFVFAQCQTCGCQDNEGAGGQQEGEFEVFAGAGWKGVVPVYDTGEATEGGFGGEVWVLIGRSVYLEWWIRNISI